MVHRRRIDTKRSFHALIDVLPTSRTPGFCPPLVSSTPNRDLWRFEAPVFFSSPFTLLLYQHFINCTVSIRGLSPRIPPYLPVIGRLGWNGRCRCFAKKGSPLPWVWLLGGPLDARTHALVLAVVPPPVRPFAGCAGFCFHSAFLYNGARPPPFRTVCVLLVSFCSLTMMIRM